MFNFQLKEMCQRLKENVETCKTWESLKRLHLNQVLPRKPFDDKEYEYGPLEVKDPDQQ